MSNLKYRVLAIVALTALSLWTLFPRNITERVRRSDGTFGDTTVRRVPLKRGLDLQGGMHLTLEVDESKGVIVNKAEAIQRALKVVRTRIDEFGVSEPNVQQAGTDRIIVELPGIDDPKRAEALVQKTAFLEFNITDESQALEKAFPRLDQILRDKGLGALPGKPGPSAVTGLQGLLTTAPDSATKGKGAKAAPTDTGTPSAPTDGPFSRAVRAGQIPGEYFVARTDEDNIRRFLELPELRAALPPGKQVLWGNDTVSIGAQAYRALYVTDSRPIITGDYLTDAKPNQDPVEGTLVTFALNNEGGRRFKNETAKNIKKYMAIVLDKKVIGRPPIIQGSIGTRGQITMGGKDLQAAQDLALVLRAGSLPVPLKVAEIRSIGASLGQDSVAKGITAGLIAVGLVVVIMIGYYRLSGVLAVGGLTLYMLFTLAALARFDAVLTLPGLAGFVLSIGIAVDANVLIFERIREELERGKTVRTAIDEGFRHAMPAILDSNVSTALTAAVLYQYGTGPVRGFAVTLIAGIAASMVTAIFVVKTFYLLWLSRERAAQTLSI
ncbi:MAG: protein translocase subunit SecD [Gemmatimonadaceae bacterium]